MSNIKRVKTIIKTKGNLISENYLYDEGMVERIHPMLENELREGRHSLADCGVFPEGDVISSEMKLIRERFIEVVNRCREAFDVNVVDNKQIMSEMMGLLKKTMELESEHKDDLIELGIKLVKEEFDIPDDALYIEAELVEMINPNELNKNKKPKMLDEEFNDHEEIKYANANVKKRRVLNAMNQGAAKKVNHMFHMVGDELTELNPRLLPNYKKLMSAADYMYFIVPDMTKGVAGGLCECDYNTEDENGEIKPIIKVKANSFPVLIHELVKGVMEVLSSKGLPTEKNIAEYVLGKADFLHAEPWDMRLGPGIWGRFCDSIPDEDINLKHYVYSDLCQMEPIEFNSIMQEVLAKTKKGKNLILDIVKNIKEEIKQDEFNETMGDSFFESDELI